jgi:hypothetical protein
VCMCICQWRSDYLLQYTGGLGRLWTCQADPQHASRLHLQQQALNSGTSAMLQPVSVHVAGKQLHASASAVIGMHGRLGAAAALRLRGAGQHACQVGTACLQLVQRDCTHDSIPHSCQWPVAGPCREHPP